MLKKITSVLLTLLLTASVFGMPFSACAKTYKQELIDKGFPESYANALVTLHEKYPNWVFEPFITDLDWQTAVDGERSYHSKQVIQKTSSRNEGYYCQCSKCKPNGVYKIQEGSSWVSASEAAVKYYMDPRNWLSETYIYQFESTSYESNQTKSGVESIISSTWMKNADITYKTTEGKTATYKNSSGNTVKYSQAIIDAAKYSKMSAYYLASKIVQEVGATNATTGGSCGTRNPFLGIYNYYNIGAYSGAMDGLEWASGFLRTNKQTTLYEYDSEKKEYVAQKDNKGNDIKLKSEQYFCYISKSGDYYKGRLYNENDFSTNGTVGYIAAEDVRTTYLTYGRPWTNPYLTIYNGAKYISNGFSTYQYTCYLQKFNVNKASPSLYNNEYMANVQGAASEAQITKKAYSDANILSGAKTFYIPVFKNMPSSKCAAPTGSSSSGTTAAVSNPVTGLTLDSRTKTSLTFKWNSFSGASKYYIYVYNNTKKTSFNKTVTTNSATLNGLTPANEYAVKVKAYTSKGWQDYSSTNTKHTLPEKMEKPKVKSTGDTYVELTFSPMSGADGYYIYEYDSSSKKYTKLKTVENGSANSAKVTVKSASKHSFAISAFTVDSKTKEGAKSDKVSATTKPLKVTLKSVSSPSTTKIKATWGAATGGESGYEIYYGKDKNFKTLAAKKEITSKKTSSYTGKNFTKGNTYYIKVRSYKTENGKKKYGSWSNVKSIKCK